MTMQTKILIDGQLVEGQGVEETVVNPATGETLVKVREASEAQVAHAVQAAGRAFASWSLTTPQERSVLLLKLADRIEREGRAFADLESLN
jgi:aminobutyraldehyde dehydrogenase